MGLLPGKVALITGGTSGIGKASEEVANVAAFLLSDRASYVTGQSIMVDGGQSVN